MPDTPAQFSPSRPKAVTRAAICPTAGVSDAQKAMYANEPEVLRMLQLPGNGFIKCMRTFEPITTNRLRVKLFQKGGKVRLAELHVYKADSARNVAR